MISDYDRIMNGETITVDCDGTKVKVRQGITDGNSVVDIDNVKGDPTVTISKDGIEHKPYLSEAEFDEIMSELPNLLFKAKHI